MKTISIIYMIFISLLTFSQTVDPKEKKSAQKVLKENYVYVPSGGSTKAFFIGKTEITNREYQEFLNAVKTTSGDSIYQSLYPDTSLWLDYKYSGESLANYYHDHPAYQNYPVVCISHNNALSYCKWLEVKLNNNNVFSTVKFTVDLPSLDEWNHAADNLYGKYRTPLVDDRIFGKDNLPLCVFDHVDPLSLKRDSTGGVEIMERNFEFERITRSVLDLPEQTLGLRHMAGNAAEFVKEKGITKGGGWMDTGYYLLNSSMGKYANNGASMNNGFRVVVKIESVL